MAYSKQFYVSIMLILSAFLVLTFSYILSDKVSPLDNHITLLDRYSTSLETVRLSLESHQNFIEDNPSFFLDSVDMPDVYSLTVVTASEGEE